MKTSQPAAIQTAPVMGSKLDRDRDIAVVAKMVRADLKAATGHLLPAGFKATVRTKRFSGGESLTVDVVSPADLRRTPEGIALAESVRAIVNAYNYDKSDPMTDHFDVQFYAHVELA